MNQYSFESFLMEILEEYQVDCQLINKSTVLLKEKIIETPLYEARKEEMINIAGKIIDEENQEPLPYVAVAIESENILSYSDNLGNFNLDIPSDVKQGVVSFHMLGYQVMSKNIADLLMSESHIISIAAKPYVIEGISIIEAVKPIKISPFGTSLRSDVLRQQGLSGSDVLRSIQYLAGIDASDDDSAEIRIRGSNADETLIIMDGIPLLNTSHYNGVFSAINADYIEEVNIYKNNQPIEYSNKTAGVVEFKSSEKIPDNIKGNINLNLLASSIILKAPLKQNILFSLSGRSTIQNISNTNFNTISNRTMRPNKNPLSYTNRNDFEVSDPQFRFYDIQSKLQYQYHDRSSLTLSYFRSNDDFNNESMTQTSIDRDRRRVLIQEELSISEQWKNEGLSFRLNHILNSNHKLTINAFYSNYDLNAEIINDFTFSSESANMPIQNDFIEIQKNTNKQKGINIKVDSEINQIEIESGIRLTNNMTDINFIRNENNILFQEHSTTETTGYSHVSYALHPSVELSGGLRLHQYTGTNSLYLSPLLSATYAYSNHLLFKSSIGKNHQFLREISIETGQNRNTDLWIAANENRIPVSESLNTMIGFTYKKENITFDLEVYHKDLNNVIEFLSNIPDQNESNNRPRFNIFSGEGYARGIDILLFGEFNQFQTQLSYTLSGTQQSFKEINRGEYYPAQTDKRHQLNSISNYAFSDFDVSLSYVYSTGRPYLDNNKVLDQIGMDRANVNQRSLISLLPDYHRVDLSASYHLDIDQYPVTISMSVFNLFNRNNVKYRQQITSLRNQILDRNEVLGTNSDLLDRTLNLNFSLSF